MTLTITSQNVDRLCGPSGASTAVILGQRRHFTFRPPTHGYGVCFATPIEDIVKLIPRDEWMDRIREKDQQQSWLINDPNIAKIPCKDQNGLGYCHAYGTTSGIEMADVFAGKKYRELSPESIGGRVTNWRNAGADPEDDLRVAVEHGACEASYMDRPHSLTPSRWKDGWEANALEHRVLEAFDMRVPGKAFDAVVTCSLLNFPVGLGFIWWSHFIHGGFQVRYNSVSRKFEIFCRNSWGGNWPDDNAGGYAWFEEGTGRGQGTPDWAFAIRVVGNRGT